MVKKVEGLRHPLNFLHGPNERGCRVFACSELDGSAECKVGGRPPSNIQRGRRLASATLQRRRSHECLAV